MQWFTLDSKKPDLGKQVLIYINDSFEIGTPKIVDSKIRIEHDKSIDLNPYVSDTLMVTCINDPDYWVPIPINWQDSEKNDHWKKEHMILIKDAGDILIASASYPSDKAFGYTKARFNPVTNRFQSKIKSFKRFDWLKLPSKPI